jgi:hypothetical protein
MTGKTGQQERAAPAKLDLKRELKQLYNVSARDVAVVEVPRMSFLMLDGMGDPNTAQAYKDAVEALYSVAYTIKFALKKAEGIDYAVMPLEGLWWADGGRDAPRDQWHWTMMIMQPECVTGAWFARGVAQAEQKKALPALNEIRFESFEEGLAAQVMHIGPFADEGPTLERLHSFIVEQGYSFRGKHHEIYLSDPRRTAPEKMRTILRQPITRASSNGASQ